MANWIQKIAQKAFAKALWVYHVNTGACNGCDIEVINTLTPYYDAERFGKSGMARRERAEPEC